MIQINLLPVRAKKRKDTTRQFLMLYALSVLVTVAAIGFLWVSRNNQIQSMERRLTQVQQEVAQYSKYDQMLKDLNKRKEVVDKKRTIIKDLQKDRDTTVRILALLSIQVPAEKVWFERLVQAGNTITLDGVALSNEAIAEFMRNLESSSYIEKGSVNLVHSRQTLMSNMKLREFQVTYRFFPFSEMQKHLKTQAS